MSQRANIFVRADSCSEPSYVIYIHAIISGLLRGCCGRPPSSHLLRTYGHVCVSSVSQNLNTSVCGLGWI